MVLCPAPIGVGGGRNEPRRGDIARGLEQFGFDVALARTLIEFSATAGAVCIVLLMVSYVFPQLPYRLLFLGHRSRFAAAFSH